MQTTNQSDNADIHVAGFPSNYCSATGDQQCADATVVWPLKSLSQMPKAAWPMHSHGSVTNSTTIVPADTPGSPQPIWQWSETNQGFLSLAALVVALAFGLHEFKKNKTANRDRRRDYVDLVIGLVDEILGFTTAIRSRFDAGEQFSRCVADWREQIIAPRFAFDAIRMGSIDDARLAVEVNKLWYSLQMDDNIMTGGHSQRLAEMETNLQNSRAMIAARRPF